MADLQAPPQLPVLIIGAGVSGLLLAHHLGQAGIPFLIFERDLDLTTRGVGWGLTLHWSLPTLKALLPDHLLQRLPEAYVDRVAVANREASTFPFFDLATGDLKAAVPNVPEAQRIRVSRERLRRLLATGIDIEWGKAFRGLKSEGDDCLTACFDDGSSAVGCLLVACDGAHSRARRELFPDRHHSYQIPVRVMGLAVQYTPQSVEPMRRLDPFTLQGTSSENDSYIFFSFLDAPGNDGSIAVDKYSCQMIVSWPAREGFFGSPSPIPFPTSNDARLELIRGFGRTWAEPFRSVILGLPQDTEVKCLDLCDFAPPMGLRSRGRAVLMGDSFHAMAMYRGEGANHAIMDVLDFAQLVTPHLINTSAQGLQQLRSALDEYEDRVVARTRPAVFASRRACLHAHDWASINEHSPLLSKRQMMLDYEEDDI